MKVPCKYNPGDKIFAKVKGFVYWPARVNPLPGDIVIPPNKIPIFFYGTHEVYFISPSSCWPYDEKNKSKWGKPRPRAYFNQGMDEIENYSTIYQYGIDPLAEDFLSQFYQFKQANGQNSTPKLLNKNQAADDKDDEEGEKELPKKHPKKRNKSGSSVSTKENKLNTKSSIILELSIPEVKIENNVEVKEELTVPTRKRRISESALSAKENKDSGDNAVDNAIENGELLKDDQGVSTRKQQKLESTGTDKKSTAGARKMKGRRPKSVVMEAIDKDKSVDNIRDIKYEPSANISEIPTAPTKDGDEELLSAPEDTDKDTASKPPINDVGESDNNLDGGDVKPITRCRAKSSISKLSNNLSVASGTDKKSDVDDSESPSVDSDNLADEDFRPATKVKRLTKKIPSQKRAPKSPVKKTPKQPKKPPVKQKKSTATKNKAKAKIDSDDSLSSISSIEDWKAKDEKQKRDYEERMRAMERQQLEKEENAVKEASKRTKAKRMSESLKMENSVVNSAQEVSFSSDKLEKTDEETTKDLADCKMDKEIMVHIVKADIVEKLEEKVEPETELKEIIDSKIPEDTHVESVPPPDEIIPEKSPKKISIDTETITETTNKIVESPVKKAVDKIVETPPVVVVAPVEKIKKVKINLKEIKMDKSTKKQKATSRKRNRKISSSASSGSEVEIVNVKPKESEPKSKRTRVAVVEKSSESDDNGKVEEKTNPPGKGSSDKLQTLQAFNVDIRSSLVLGHEDYKVCLERFKSLCEMDIDLVSLVKVWQLMDTVKKCRRYKRNEHVKQEAQAVYKRFMEIYSRASKEEINTAQSLLMQYRHQSNVQNQNVGGAGNGSSKTNGGGSAIPISVADMFQNKLSGHFESNTSKIIRQSPKSVTNNHAEESQPKPPPAKVLTEDEINEEKMRLLSVDLEAKVSDILNKIEKNVDTNPINQRSLSHLLPSSGDTAPIRLPTQWKTVTDNKSQSAVDKQHGNDNNVVSDGDDDDDEDEDDVEAIVRRIEEVAIKLTEPVVEAPPPPMTNITERSSIGSSSGGTVGGGGMGSCGGGGGGSIGGSSALDARIENLINNSFISSKETVTRPASKKQRVSSRHHKSAKPVSNPKTELPEAAASMHQHHHHHQHHHQQQQQQQQPQHQNQNISESAEPPLAALPSSSSPSSSLLGPQQHMPLPGEEQKDDIEIYDLLGV